jgi:putative heme-binding domain-containing protein
MALKHFNLTWLAILSLVLNAPLDGWSQDLHEQLSSQSLGDLAADSREFGDANRGAVVFYQQQLSCTRCHIPDREDHLLGPDLTRLGKEATDAYLIESVLDPSKVIKKGYEPVALVTNRGEVATGVLVSKDDEKIVARVVEKNFKLVEFKRSDLASAEQGETSIMPSGQMNLLTSRQQFLDLIAYLIAIRDGGAARARELVPPPSLYAARPVPEYEKRIDHAGILGSLDREAYLRGQETYDRLCINCHGTKDQPGSLPTSLRFASGKFKNGKDPHSM